MKIALVHDHLTQEGGAEKVLRVFQELYPQAPTYTLLYDKEKAHEDFQKKDIRTSFIQKLPFSFKKYQWFLPLMPLATEKHELMDYRIILSSSSAFAKGIITHPRTMHFCYCHTPTRYLWIDTHNYVKELKYNWIIKKIIPLFLNRLRLWDRLAADRVDKFMANSKTVQERIKKYYQKESVVIHPPVDTNKFFISPQPKSYYLIGGRLVAYKKYDLAVTAFNKLGIPLKIFGEGPEYVKLKKQAKKNIEFLGKVSDEEKAKLYSECLAFIHPHEEDFGLTAVEAMASGRPVLAYNIGGARETVIEEKTGKFFDEQTWEALADTVIRFKPEKYNPRDIKEHAQQFDTKIFKEKIQHYINQSWQEFQNKELC